VRAGIGYDSHRLVAGRDFILGGVAIPSERGLIGHSDADVLVHAVCDAIIGALGAGDIGRHFPDTDPRYRGISSLVLLARVREMAAAAGFVVGNVDTTVIVERPKLAAYIAAMSANIAASLDIAPERVNVKAKTNEGLGFLGREEGVAAYAVVILAERGGA
jgi:2-C-methyl-D-erythritol 2,4-cyclodiphosphate synthase